MGFDHSTLLDVHEEVVQRASAALLDTGLGEGGVPDGRGGLSGQDDSETHDLGAGVLRIAGSAELDLGRGARFEVDCSVFSHGYLSRVPPGLTLWFMYFLSASAA